MKAYYGSRISENMTMTPEGFLICLAVPIARCGVQNYLPDEIGLEGEELLPVTRLREDVFSIEALSSFEGKPVTLNHPSTGLEPCNICAFQKGHAQNVRRGEGEFQDLMLADLFITDPELIRLIRFGGVREISCGYECEYEQAEGGRIVQRGIRGNHIAVVMHGRAGSRVAIKDSITKRGGKRHMKKTGKNTLLGRMFAGWAKDAEIEEVAQAVEELCEGALTDELLHEELRADCGCEVLLKELKVAIEALIQKLDEKVFARDKDDPMSELLDELTGEAAVTVSEDEEEPVLDEEEIAQGGEESAEVAMAAIKAIQPIIAKLPEAEQFAAADAAARQIRRAMGRTPRPRVSGYRMALRGQLSRGSVRDSRNLGAEIMAKYNPHYK